MAKFDCREYARQMRENCAKDQNGNIICSAELWEQIASIIESSADVVPKSAVEKIFEEIDKIVHGYRVDKLLAELGVHIVKRGESTLEQRIAELKNKYLATDTNDGCKYTESEGNE